MFSCGYFSSLSSSKGQGCYSGIIIHIKQSDLEGEMQNLSPIFFCLISLLLFAKSHKRKQLHFLPNQKGRSHILCPHFVRPAGWHATLGQRWQKRWQVSTVLPPPSARRMSLQTWARSLLLSLPPSPFTRTEQDLHCNLILPLLRRGRWRTVRP